MMTTPLEEQTAFNAVKNNVSFPQQEEEILKFWQENNIYDRSLEQREGAERYVFFEGPPTANGKPHPGHCLTRAMKDLFPRYKTMKGLLLRTQSGLGYSRPAGRSGVCKEMGIHSKEEIEDFGVEPFIHKCQQSVWQYMQQWNS